ncbi:MAG: hypothetical protein PVG30_07650 [Gammaproteobacteria bacterium]|jgi:hypothetical protein
MSEIFRVQFVYENVNYNASCRYPSECPRCGKNIHVDARNCKSSMMNSQLISKDFSNVPVQIVIQCPACAKMFMADYNYKQLYLDNSNGKDVTVPTKIYPQDYIQLDIAIPEHVHNLSENFVELYRQSYQAEIQNLKDICGSGYRKSLEFLIKDYCIHKNSADKIKIEKMFLKNCIDKYVEEEKIKKCAERAAWLGNDETHYYRKWGDKDLSDLKKLIKLTVFWIEAELLTEQYDKEMEQ